MSHFSENSVAPDDRLIVDALLRRDPDITKDFLYRRCYPLFKAVFDRYFTDCESVVELIGQIYLFIMAPRPSTGRSKLSQFSFRCSFTMWLKIVAENYCRQIFARQGDFSTQSLDDDDRKPLPDESLLENDGFSPDAHDIRRVLDMMPNPRYRALIEARYLNELSNEDTAACLGLSMANYYNTHKRAKEQFCNCLRKEGLI